MFDRVFFFFFLTKWPFGKTFHRSVVVLVDGPSRDKTCFWSLANNKAQAGRQSDQQPLLLAKLLESIISRLTTIKIPIFYVTKSL